MRGKVGGIMPGEILIDANKLKAIFENDNEPYELKWSSNAILTEIDDLINATIDNENED